MTTESDVADADIENVELVESESDEEVASVVGANPISSGSSSDGGEEKSSKSIVWRHFIRKKVIIKGLTKQKVMCQHCKKLYVADSVKNGTTSLRNHLYRCPASPLFMGSDQKQPMLCESSGLGKTVVPHTFDQKRLDLELVEWIIAAELPFRIVEHPKFKIWVKDLCPKYFLPSRKEIAKGLWELYNLEKAKIKSVLGDVRVSITTDTWTLIQNVNYMVITAHFIDSNFTLHKRVINFCQITSHKGDGIGRCLEDKLNEWGIDKVFSITVDNASSNDVAVEHMKKRMRSYGTLLLDGSHLHMRCACHIINLVVKDGMKELFDSIDGIRNCVKYIHSSSARLESFRRNCWRQKKDRMSTIPLDVVTRWNATYSMLSSAHKFNDVFDLMTEEDVAFQSYFKESVDREIDGRKVNAKRLGPPNKDDWDKALSFSHFLKKFYDATLTLSATKTPTSHLILRTWINLKMDIDAKILDDGDMVLQDVACSIKTKFDKYWGSFEDLPLIMFVAQVLDPRLKFQLLDIILLKLHYNSEDVERVKGRVRGCLNDLYVFYKGESVDGSNVVVHLEEDDGDEDDEDDLLRMLNQQRMSAKMKEISNEVDKYLSDAHESAETRDFDILLWWRVHSGDYPTLCRIAKDVLAIPSSTVSSENAFSLEERVVDPFRASLTPKTAEALVCTTDWLRGDEVEYYKEPTEDALEFYKELENLELGYSKVGDLPPQGSKSVVEVEGRLLPLPPPSTTSEPNPNLKRKRVGKKTLD